MDWQLRIGKLMYLSEKGFVHITTILGFAYNELNDAKVTVRSKRVLIVTELFNVFDSNEITRYRWMSVVSGSECKYLQNFRLYFERNTSRKNLQP